MPYASYFFAQTYNSGAYGASTYQGSATSTSSGGGTSSGTGSGVLTNTGFDVLLAVTLACAIIFGALIIRFWKRPVSSKKA